MKVGKQYRSITLERAEVDAESRTLSLSFSSEYPVERYFGREILSHAPGAADLSRLNGGAPLLFNHDADKLIGVIESASISGGRGAAIVRFSKNPLGEQMMQDVRDGILKNVSFGYRIHEMQMTKSSQDEGEEYTATRWEPFEISLVTVPADPTVGVGRADDGEANDVKVISNTKEEKAEMPTEAEMKAARDQERARIETIRALGDKFQKPELAKQLIDGDKSIDEARAAFLEVVQVNAKPVSGKEAEIGMSEKEVRKFSWLRALHALANPNDRKAYEAASFEREVSEAAQKHTGRSAKGFMVPFDVLRGQEMKRDLVKGTPTAGGNLVATELLAGSFIDILRNRAVLFRAGAQQLSGLVGDISVPRATGAATAYWVGEGAALTESEQAFDQVRMSPKTVGALTDYSRKLLLQSSIDVEALIRADLAAVLALEIDRVGLYGLGSASQPQGLNAIGSGGGLNTVNFAGANPTFAEIIQMESEIAADNADAASMAYLVHSRGRGHLKSTEKFSSTGMTIWEAGDTVNGYRAEVSNQLVVTGGTDPDYWFGAWANMIYGFWSGLDLMVDPYAGATSGNVRVIAMQDLDLMVRRPQFFCKGANNP